VIAYLRPLPLRGGEDAAYVTFPHIILRPVRVQALSQLRSSAATW
jgi:hypothetical protein